MVRIEADGRTRAMNVKIYRCKDCGKRLAPWRVMCPNCRRFLPAVLLLAVCVIVPGMYLLLLLLEWVFDWPLG
jgi:hypothetical protein